MGSTSDDLQGTRCQADVSKPFLDHVGRVLEGEARARAHHAVDPEGSACPQQSNGEIGKRSCDIFGRNSTV
eukprot:3798675-Pyramimonas_sp.AAC.1